jgi:hypothetical protein
MDGFESESNGVLHLEQRLMPFKSIKWGGRTLLAIGCALDSGMKYPNCEKKGENHSDNYEEYGNAAGRRFAFPNERLVYMMLFTSHLLHPLYLSAFLSILFLYNGLRRPSKKEEPRRTAQRPHDCISNRELALTYGAAKVTETLDARLA